jgi:hypothetical protein
MKNLYETFNDLKEAAEKFGFEVVRLNDIRAVVFGPLGATPYTRGNDGWRKGGNTL